MLAYKKVLNLNIHNDSSILEHLFNKGFKLLAYSELNWNQKGIIIIIIDV